MGLVQVARPARGIRRIGHLEQIAIFLALLPAESVTRMSYFSGLPLPSRGGGRYPHESLFWE